MKRLLELFAGSCAVSKAFAARGWTGVAVDLNRCIDPPRGFDVWIWNVLNVTEDFVRKFDFAWASSPCEEFAVWGMKHFHPDPKYPAGGIRLFTHTREILEKSGISYIMENVRAAEQFVGPATHHAGSFYLWGNAVPPLLPSKLQKKDNFHALPGNLREKVLKAGLDLREARNRYQQTPGHPRREELLMTGGRIFGSATKSRAEATAAAATIPPELANCVADYAERLLEQKSLTGTNG